MSELLNDINANPDARWPSDDVIRMRHMSVADLQTLLQPYHMQVVSSPAGESIPGSFWGDEEAGLIDNRLYVRPDTPLHSALHEACHYICMAPDRRAELDTNAGGDYDEENGVCYLQIVLAAQMAGLNKSRMMADMDRWGYSFRLGSTQAWFEQDAEDARNWLIKHNILDQAGQLTWRYRGQQ